MSVMLVGSGLQIMLAAPGRPMLAAPLPTGGSGPADPRSLAGLVGWWDGATPAGLLGTSGAPLSGFGAPVAGLADRSGAGAALTVWHRAGTGTAPPLGTARLNGLLGGVGRDMGMLPDLPPAGRNLPWMDPDQGLIGPEMNLGSGTAWTLYLVWSRPNWRQSTTTPSALLSIGGTTVLAADNRSGTNRLVLFPGASQTVLTIGLTRRHTHAIVLRNTPGVGLDVWLDAGPVATAVPNPLAASLNAPALFLHDGTPNGGAECWFHEAAIWNNALGQSSLNLLLTWQSRWTRGPRKGIQVLVTGQSNAGNGLNDGAWHLLAQGVAWHLGALGYGVAGLYGSPPAATCIHGEGLYPVVSLGLPGSFLQNPADGTDPSTWALGADGLAVRQWLQSGTAAEDAADISVILWPWSEDDSTRGYNEKSTYDAAARRFLALERGMLSRLAASLPQIWWSALPFNYANNDAGTQMQRETVASIAADPSQNVTVVLPQTADSLPRNVTSYDPATGTWTGGDWLHRDAGDNRRFGRLAAPLAARAILASGGGDTISSIPAGIPALGGPVVTHVYRETAASLIVTVRHDCGTDLIVPATQAAAGVGWAAMDGGTMASPGRIVAATACARIDATHLRVTLARNLTNASAACRLFYPYGTATIGRGNAVTDNFSAVAKPAGWDIGADLGTAWRYDMPVHVPMTPDSGVAVSDTV